MQGKVLVVDDERSIVDILRFNLEKEGFEVCTGSDGLEALMLFEREQPDIILLDVMLPQMDGLEVCRKIRERSHVPILMLTARAEEVDKVLGLELGADDYITKPFSVRELMARVRTNIRRVAAMQVDSPRKQSLVAGRLVLDLERYEVRKSGAVLDITLREMELLRFLMENRGQIFSRETLMEQVWSYEHYGDVRTVDVTIRRIREKIEDEPSTPELILTKRGIGYYFNDKY